MCKYSEASIVFSSCAIDLRLTRFRFDKHGCIVHDELAGGLFFAACFMCDNCLLYLK